MELGAGRKAPQALGTSQSWEILLSSGGRLQFIDILFHGIVSNSEEDKKKVLYQSMKVDKKDEKAGLWNVLFKMGLLMAKEEAYVKCTYKMARKKFITIN